MNDLRLFLTQWLTENPADEYDFFEDDSDIIDMYDFGAFAEGWRTCSDWQRWGDDNCYEAELLEADINDDGIVNMVDFAILTKSWMSEDNHIRANIDRLGAVDYTDLSIMAEQWLMKSWIYWVSN